LWFLVSHQHFSYNDLFVDGDETFVNNFLGFTLKMDTITLPVTSSSFPGTYTVI